MDEDLYRQAYRAANPMVCEFEKALLSQTWQCRYSRRVCVADRQGVSCSESGARGLCGRFLGLLRQRSQFALQLSRIASPLPHSAEIRVQLGGLDAARAMLAGTGQDGADIIDLLRAMVDRHGDLESIPYAELVKGVAAHRSRRRDRRGRSD